MSAEEDCEKPVCFEGNPEKKYQQYSRPRYDNMGTDDDDLEINQSESGDQYSLTSAPKKDLFLEECPNTRASLGFFTWNFLHTMTMYYPSNPTISESTDMKEFMRIFTDRYPCTRTLSSD